MQLIDKKSLLKPFNASSVIDTAMGRVLFPVDAGLVGFVSPP